MPLFRCERMALGTDRSTQLLAPYWSGVSEVVEKPLDADYPSVEHLPKMRLKAVFVDGHVATYTEQDVVALDVISNRKTLLALKALACGGWTATRQKTVNHWPRIPADFASFAAGCRKYVYHGIIPG